MAEEVWYVSYDIQEAGGAIPSNKSTTNPYYVSKIGEKLEGSFPVVTQETNAINTPGGEGFVGPISSSKNVEVTASTAAEAIEVVRKVFGQNVGKCRALAKPNTNFKVVA